MSGALTRRALLASGLASLAAAPVLASGADLAPSAASLARPSAAPRDFTGLEIVDADGTALGLADMPGRLFVVNLWAPWCLPCRREMPSLARLSERLDGSDIRVVPIAFDWRGPSGVRRFFREIGVETLPVLIGDGDNLMATLGIELLPTTVIVNAAGQLLATVAGEATWDDEATLAWLQGLA